ncbi:MAG: BON domain-containing protein [Burkholderiales bacterium]|nr:BON domain-containing protein [Burkholderiales bacterium]
MLSKYLTAAFLGIAVVTTTVGCAVGRGQQSAGQFVDDSAITAAIKSRFATDQTVAATSIGVETLNGTVQLTGFAKSQAEKDRAAAIARDAHGVKSVRNDIIVRP